MFPSARDCSCHPTNNKDSDGEARQNSKGKDSKVVPQLANFDGFPLGSSSGQHLIALVVPQNLHMLVNSSTVSLVSSAKVTTTDPVTSVPRSARYCIFSFFIFFKVSVV